MDDEMWEKINLQIKSRQFELASTMPISWKSISLSLKHAADRLFDLYHDASLRILERLKSDLSTDQADNKKRREPRELHGQELDDFKDAQLISAYSLLAGYALENLLKALLILQHPEYFRRDDKLTGVRTHDLIGLCGKCDFKIDNGDKALLRKLKEHIVWQGKYPVPLLYEDMFPRKGPDGSWETRGEAFHFRKQQEEFNDLYLRIWQELESQQDQAPSSESK